MIMTVLRPMAGAGVARRQGQGLQSGLPQGIQPAGRGGDGEAGPVHSFRTLLADLATLTRNTVCFGGQATLTVLATPTSSQRRALDLLGVELAAA